MGLSRCFRFLNKIMVNSGPNILFKYQSFNESTKDRIKKIFFENLIYFPSPSTFNDPFDCKVSFSFNKSKNAWKRYLSKLSKKNKPDWSRAQRRQWIREKLKEKLYAEASFQNGLINQMQDEVDSAGVFCLSERFDDILMWSHYSDGHKGICIGFKAGRHIPFFGEAQRVYYKRRYPKISFLAEGDKMVDSILLTKSEHWKYELEWRIIKPHEGPGEYEFPADFLEQVIFGCLMEEDYRNKIIEWSQQRNNPPKLFQATKKNNKFGLELIPL